jgi:hypothetical protein
MGIGKGKSILTWCLLMISSPVFVLSLLLYNGNATRVNYFSFSGPDLPSHDRLSSVFIQVLPPARHTSRMTVTIHLLPPQDTRYRYMHFSLISPDVACTDTPPSQSSFQIIYLPHTTYFTHFPNIYVGKEEVRIFRATKHKPPIGMFLQGR